MKEVSKSEMNRFKKHYDWVLDAMINGDDVLFCPIYAPNGKSLGKFVSKIAGISMGSSRPFKAKTGYWSTHVEKLNTNLWDEDDVEEWQNKHPLLPYLKQPEFDFHKPSELASSFITEKHKRVLYNTIKRVYKLEQQMKNVSTPVNGPKAITIEDVESDLDSYCKTDKYLASIYFKQGKTSAMNLAWKDLSVEYFRKHGFNLYIESIKTNNSIKHVIINCDLLNGAKKISALLAKGDFS